MNEKRAGNNSQDMNRKRSKYLKWIGVGVCGIAILTLAVYLTQSKQTASEQSEPTNFKNIELVEPKKSETPAKKKEASKKNESVEDIYKNYGVTGSSAATIRADNGNSTLSSNDLRSIAQVYNERRAAAVTSTPQTENILPVVPDLPISEPAKPTPVLPDLEPEPIIPTPVISIPTIHLTQSNVVAAQGSLFSPYNYFTVENGNDSNTTIQVTNVDTTILGQHYCTIIATNSAGTSEQTISIFVNALPVIHTASEIIDVPLRSTTNLLNDVTATDAEDGDITEKISVETNLDTTTEGEYSVTFSVTDSHGFSSSKTVTARVTNEAPVIEAEDIEIEIDQPFNPLDHVKVVDREDGEIKLTEENILKNEVDVTTEGTYLVTIGKVKDSDGKEAEKTFKVTVKNELPVITVPETLLKVGDVFDTAAFKESITVSDREDDKKGLPIALTFDEEALKLVLTEKAATFIVTIEATDSHGGKNSTNASIIVEAKETPEEDIEIKDNLLVEPTVLIPSLAEEILIYSNIPTIDQEQVVPDVLSSIEVKAEDVSDDIEQPVLANDIEQESRK